MTDALQTLLSEPQLQLQLARHGLATIRERHTCRHRVDELLTVVNEVRTSPGAGSRETHETNGDARSTRAPAVRS
jgi:spore maturation protein CgeB